MARQHQTKFELQREASERKSEMARDRAARKRKGQERQAKVAAAEAPKPRKRDPAKNFLRLAGLHEISWERSAPLDAALENLVRDLSRVAPKVLIRENVQPLKRLVRMKKYWLRNLDGWRPSGSSKHRQLRSLIEHLLCKYPTPHFLLNVFHSDDMAAPNEELYVHFARGGSVMKAIEKRLLPTVMTKKMAHNFLQSSPHSNVLHAVRRAQIEAYGGDRRIVKAVCETRFGRGFDPDEQFWLTVIQWVCNQPMMNPGQIGPIFDWVNHRRAQNRNFSMKGRNALSVIRDMENWHNELAKIHRMTGGAIYPKSGFAGNIWEVQKTPAPEIWSCTEIGTAKELSDEGKTMHHCVYSYSDWCSKGRVSIWSLRCDGVRQLTLEVNNQTRSIVQARGVCNKSPSPTQHREMRRWATASGLSIATYTM